MARKKKTVENIRITGIADKGKAIGRDATGKVYFVEDAVPGDLVDVLVLRKKKGVPFGKAVKFREFSENRSEPFCSHFGICGGCKWQNLSYEEQLNQKQMIVDDAIKRIAKIQDYESLPILPSEHIQFYRNKLEFTFSSKRWLTQDEIDSGTEFSNRNALGFHRPGAFDKVVDIDKCYLMSELTNEILNFVRDHANANHLEFFDIRQQLGLLRNLIIRRNQDGEYMLIFSFYHRDEENIHKLLSAVAEEFDEIKNILFVINSKKNDTIFDLEVERYKGDGYLKEVLGETEFKIGPKSFFQTNSIQAKNLYDVVMDFADLKGNETVYDLYTGLGSIALYVAPYCKSVIGVEEIEAAIEDANENKKLNGIDNAEFYCGDVKDIVNNDFFHKHGNADLVICDPPRAGMHKDLIETLLKLKAPMIVNVSCNPSTQARDLALLSESYELIKSRAVDMFPHTNHIENVVLLELK